METGAGIQHQVDSAHNNSAHTGKHINNLNKTAASNSSSNNSGSKTSKTGTTNTTTTTSNKNQTGTATTTAAAADPDTAGLSNHLLMPPATSLSTGATATPNGSFTSNLNGVNGIDPEALEDAMSDLPALQRSPAKAPRGSGRGRGRGSRGGGRGGRISKPAPKPAPPKPVSGRGRRQKLYEWPKAQAAYERAQELKSNYNALSRQIKPALEELADRNIKKLQEDLTAIEQGPEYQEAMTFLARRRDDAIEQSARRYRQERAMAEVVWKGEQENARKAHEIQVEEMCEERMAQLMIQLDVLEYLHDNNLPLDLQQLPEDAEYLYKNISQEQADSQSIYVEIRDGVEVPFHGRMISEMMTKEYQLPESPKRKAEDQPEGQPTPKIVATAKDDDVIPELLRHSNSLLGGHEAVEDRPPTPPEAPSTAPTPPRDAPSPSPENHQVAQVSGVTTPIDPLELTLPRGAGPADEYGVRIISRRPTRSDIPNNRIMVPSLFEWDDEEIGFRDSTNCPQKGATKARRGRFLGKPGSNYFFVDRRVGTWDSTKAEGELDEALVKEYGLHPTLGLVLPTSNNPQGPPTPLVSGWKPVALVAPSGEIIHSSRVIPRARLDLKASLIEKKMSTRQAIREFCETEGIEEVDISPEKALREKHRRKQLLARGLNPDRILATPTPTPQPETPEPGPDETIFKEFVEGAINAAAAIDAEQEAERAAVAQHAQLVRPYDAIRDIFNEPIASKKTPENSQNLSLLADLATSTEQQPLHFQSRPTQPQYVPEHASEMSMIDPELFGQGQQPPNGRSAAFDRPEPRHIEYPRPEAIPHPPAQYLQPGEQLSAEPPRSDDFLRTTLNPQPSIYPPPPVSHVPDYGGVLIAPAPPQGSPLAAAGRMPFSNTGAGKGLPALRPHEAKTPPPESQDGSVPSPAQHQIMNSISGAYYPPAPHRPFHNGYTIQEQQQMGGHLMQPMLQQPAPPHGQPMMQTTTGPLPGPPPQVTSRQMSPYSGPPPAYHPPLAPAPAQIPPVGPAQSHPPAQPLMAPMLQPAPLPPPQLVTANLPGQQQGQQQPLSASSPSPRSSATATRPGSSSAAVPTLALSPSGVVSPSSASGMPPAGSAPGSASAAASSKYRKLEPAPTPPHRMGYTANGQELRTVPFDYMEAIKDYKPVEAPPRHGPTQIRGWTHNNLKKNRGGGSNASSSSSGSAKNGKASSVDSAAATAESVPATTTAVADEPS